MDFSAHPPKVEAVASASISANGLFMDFVPVAIDPGRRVIPAPCFEATTAWSDCPTTALYSEWKVPAVTTVTLKPVQ